MITEIRDDDFFIIEKTFRPPASKAAQLINTCYERFWGLFKAKVVDCERIQMLEHEELVHAAIAIDQLYNTMGRFHSNTVVSECLKVFQKEAEDSTVAFSESGISYADLLSQKAPFFVAEELYPEYCEKDQLKYMIVPYNLVQHHVVIFVDIERRRVEYYDPLGFSPSHFVTKSRGHTFNLVEHIEAIRERFFLTEGTIFINKSPHQNCACCCGIWSLWYIHQRLKGIEPEAIEDLNPGDHGLDRFRLEVLVPKIKQNALRELALIDATP